MSETPAGPLWRRIPESIGASVRASVEAVAAGIAYIGGASRLLGDTALKSPRTLRPRGLQLLLAQCFRFGVRSIPIVCLVQVFIGIILALNLAPTMEAYGQIERVADVVAIGVLRELGPLITAILLSGFAGASIAAELGAMVEGEEVKALRAHALDPVRFLVVPRVAATMVMLVLLTILADLVGVLGGYLTAVFVLDVPSSTYLDLTRAAVGVDDYLTGLSKSAVFGVIIAGIACYEGLNVRGGAESVGIATTVTVVKSIFALIAADVVFTIVFYVLGW